MGARAQNMKEIAFSEKVMELLLDIECLGLQPDSSNEWSNTDR